ncbi:MAG: DMT family transporter [Pseudomonadales bacterium]|nr:DMT family transporter [Pseudomonadales bacterium]
MQKDSLLKGALYILAAEFLLSAMAAIIKHLSQELPIEMIVFFRNFFGLLALLPLLAHGGLSQLRTNRIGMHLLRGLTGVTAMYGFFFVIGNIPLTEAVLVKLTTPFFLPIITFLWLGEAIRSNTKWAIVIGFIGVIFILRPGADNFEPLAIIGVFAAVFASFAKVCIRRMATTEPSIRIVFYFGLICSSVTAIPLIWSWQTPSTETWLWLIGMGIIGSCGQILMTRGYQVANPGQIGPYVYSSLIYASAFGWYFWGETPLLTTAIGCVFIIGAGLWNMKKPTVRQKQDAQDTIAINNG